MSVARKDDGRPGKATAAEAVDGKAIENTAGRHTKTAAKQHKNSANAAPKPRAGTTVKQREPRQSQRNTMQRSHDNVPTMAGAVTDIRQRDAHRIMQ